jgi:DNA-binding CsgD family transcriptional regulator
MPALTPDETLAAFLPDLYVLKHADEFPAHALRIVTRAIDGNKADYTQLDLATGDFQVLVSPEPPQLRALAAARHAHMREHPVLNHFRHSAAPDARLISDFLTPRAFRRLGLYGEFFAHLGVEDQLTALVTRPESTVRVGISIDRDRPRFEERDRRLLDLLRPHLCVARENAARFSKALAATPENAEALDRLTERQRDVLAALSRGLTDAQVALELDISVHTVRKHVEHILRRLEASTRTAAAACYLAGRDFEPAPEWTASISSFVT